LASVIQETQGPQAMLSLGSLYDYSLGVTQDYGKAREWYQKAADTSNASAMNSLGWLYPGRLGHRPRLRKGPRARKIGPVSVGRDEASIDHDWIRQLSGRDGTEQRLRNVLPPLTLTCSIWIRNRVRVLELAEVLVAFSEEEDALEILIVERLICLFVPNGFNPRLDCQVERLKFFPKIGRVVGLDRI